MAKVYTDKKGYKRYADSDKLVHREVWEKSRGMKLKEGAVVHHKDGDKGNFRSGNLWAYKDQSTHMKEEHSKKKKSWF